MDTGVEGPQIGVLGTSTAAEAVLAGEVARLARERALLLHRLQVRQEPRQAPRHAGESITQCCLRDPISVPCAHQSARVKCPGHCSDACWCTARARQRCSRGARRSLRMEPRRVLLAAARAASQPSASAPCAQRLRQRWRPQWRASVRVRLPWSRCPSVNANELLCLSVSAALAQRAYPSSFGRPGAKMGLKTAPRCKTCLRCVWLRLASACKVMSCACCRSLLSLRRAIARRGWVRRRQPRAQRQSWRTRGAMPCQPRQGYTSCGALPGYAVHTRASPLVFGLRCQVRCDSAASRLSMPPFMHYIQICSVAGPGQAA